MHKRLYILLCLCFSLILSGCYYSHPNKMDHWAANGEGAVDSVNFYINHHYWTGYNFRSTDTLSLQTAPPLAGLPDYGAIVNDTIAINSHDQLVVARVMYVPADSTDSVWVKVARDQLTQGWIHESTLLEHVVPDDPISKFIYYLDRKSVV